MVGHFSRAYTPSRPTIQLVPSDDTLHLNVIELYWGTRVMIQRLTEDAAMMKKAEAYVSKHFG